MHARNHGGILRARNWEVTNVSVNLRWHYYMQQCYTSWIVRVTFIYHLPRSGYFYNYLSRYARVGDGYLSLPLAIYFASFRNKILVASRAVLYRSSARKCFLLRH